MFRVVLVFCWCFIWVLVELNIIIVKVKPCQYGYSQEETKYDYSVMYGTEILSRKTRTQDL